MVFFTCIGVGSQLSFVPIEFLLFPVGNQVGVLLWPAQQFELFRTINLRKFVGESIAMINSVSEYSWNCKGVNFASYEQSGND